MSRPSAHRHVATRPLPDHDPAHARARGECLVSVRLQRYERPTPVALVLREEHLAAHVVQAIRERLSREAAEDDRVRSAEPCAREHRDRKAGAHAHVDPDGRALPDADRLQSIRGAHDLVEQLAIRDGRALPDRLALVVERDAVAVSGLDVAVEAVVGDVQLPAAEPLRVRELPLEE